jgi:hypothetical protein
VTPRGRTVSLLATEADAPLYRFSQTWLPGTYRVRFMRGGKPVGETPFHVARDARESDVRTLAEADKSKLLAAGLLFGEVTADTAATHTETAPRREPFWGLLLSALVLLLAGELLLAGGLARQRHGLVVSAH